MLHVDDVDDESVDGELLIGGIGGICGGGGWRGGEFPVVVTDDVTVLGANGFGMGAIGGI